MRRPTIVDIAKAAGVSKGAVSYALNGRPGVSDRTRERILTIARDLGWAPNGPARALAPGGLVGAVGMVVGCPVSEPGAEPFLTRLVLGIESELTGSGVDLLLQVTASAEAEEAAYRRWAAERRVDGVIVVDLREDDHRTDLVRELPLSAVVLGGPEGTDGLPCLWTDEAAMMYEVVHYLAALGHRNAVQVAGPEHFKNTGVRAAAFAGAARDAGLERAATVHADYTGDEGARATRRLLAHRDRPTALVYGNDLMAVAGLGVAAEMGISVPDELSVVAWDDSVLCRLVRPSLTAVSRDVEDSGAQVARMLTRMVAGERVRTTESTRGELVPRDSTGPLA